MPGMGIWNTNLMKKAREVVNFLIGIKKYVNEDFLPGYHLQASKAWCKVMDPGAT
ncbi:hypothetical protein FOXB_02105 [Fusarium oxysporum f. sp. conglutinans Fo5176]|uniref:Uncharacterized protein n=1 Tax=Fusarium oxysporum (strain Fo5176) TaxID=660025 RepID=F9F6T0_FUSOF|nr:hypothetical protein FOXB_02105 [Fusarium oxysporum f. sp. conglutinans Fo5176]